MQKRLPIILALAAGLVAAFLTSLYVDEVRRSSQPTTTEIMVAARDLRPGTVLDAKDVAAGQRYAAGLPKFAVRWSERNIYLGQPLKMAVTDGDYVLASYFGAEAAGGERLSERLEAAKRERAVTIPVSNETSLEGSLRPGDRVDLLLTYQGAAGGGGASSLTTTPLLENGYVLATGTYGARPNEPYSSITLLVAPEQAKLLVWARNLGQLSVLLRNPKDLEPTDRAFLSGDASALAALGAQPLTIADALAGGAASKRTDEKR
jgi:pilus assembly protein CpaB